MTGKIPTLFPSSRAALTLASNRTADASNPGHITVDAFMVPILDSLANLNACIAMATNP
jgi:hypothetical protein